MGALASAVLFMHAWCWNGSVRWCCASAVQPRGGSASSSVPLVEYSAATVDMRMRSTFKAEHVLTADLVPVNVGAVLFWTVWDAGRRARRRTTSVWCTGRRKPPCAT
ncbi:MAG: hypothetical protein ACLSVD_10195 [Eggerthellaceae bacterium]